MVHLHLLLLSFFGPFSVLLQNVRRFTACPLFAELFLIAACNLLLFANNSIWFHFPGPQAVQRAPQSSRRRMVGSDRTPAVCAAHTHLDRILCDFLRVRSNFQIISWVHNLTYGFEDSQLVVDRRLPSVSAIKSWGEPCWLLLTFLWSFYNRSIVVNGVS